MPPPEATHNDSGHDASKCEFCRHFRDFALPDHLLDALTKGNVVVFAGAGVSTENSLVFPWTLYEQVHGLLKLPDTEKPPFPELMGRYCAQPDGRRALLEKIRERFAYVTGFPELYRIASRFHQELSTLFYIDTYVTTNWDDYFERECGATPFVTADDFALWNVPGRKVFKIHGSVSNYGSIVATQEDYAKTEAQLEKGALGAALKMLLATKTLLYVGYSFTDDDFLSIRKYISEELRKVAPAAYIVTIDHASEARFRALGLTPIFTDATHFLSVLKKHLSTDKHFLPDERLDGVRKALTHARAEHHRLLDTYSAHRNPEILYAAFYQDGLKHAFERVIAMRHTGEYSHRCDLVTKIHKYEAIKADNLRRKRYADVAYIEGYMNGLYYLLIDDKERKKLPFYYIHGQPDQPRTLPEYGRLLRRTKPHKAAMSAARKMVSERLGPNDVPHHRPFIDWTVPL